MPTIFDTLDKTELVAFLAKNGPQKIYELCDTFNVPATSILRRLRVLMRCGIVARARDPDRYASHVYCLNSAHPAYEEIADMGQALAKHFKLPKASSAHRRVKIPGNRQAHANDPLATLAWGRSPLRGQILLLLAALDEPIPISYLGGMLAKDRFAISQSVNTLEAFRITRSTRAGNKRLIDLDPAWEAYPQLVKLLGRLNVMDPTYHDLAASYLEANRRVLYVR